MQTFMPFNDYTKIPILLDQKRSFNQIKEGSQIMFSMCFPNYGWSTHPAVKMWYGYGYSLIDYVAEFNNFYRNSNRSKNTHHLSYIKMVAAVYRFKLLDKHRRSIFNSTTKPLWTSEQHILDSHKHMLFCKNQQHYHKFQNVRKYYDYIWATDYRKSYDNHYRKILLDFMELDRPIDWKTIKNQFSNITSTKPFMEDFEKGLDYIKEYREKCVSREIQS